MGRKRTKHHNLPPGVQPKGRRWYYGRSSIPLGIAGSPEALRKWAELAGERYDEAAPTFADAAREYRLRELASKAPKTQREYARQLTLLVDVFGRMLLDQITPGDVYDFLALRPKIAGTREKALLSAVFNFARTKARMTAVANPCAGVRGTKAHRDRYVSDAELRDVLTRADPMLAGFLELCYLTGQRPSDVLQFRRQDLQDGALCVRQAKTGVKVRIAIVGPLQAVLARLTAGTVGNVHLVRDRAGERMTLQAVRRRFKTLGCTWQVRDLRAKAASDSASARAAQVLLGHAAATTTDTYIRQRAGERATPIMRGIAEETENYGSPTAERDGRK